MYVRWGAFLQGLAMATLGVLGAWGIPFDLLGNPVVQSEIAAWACIGCIYVFVFAFAWSWGPVCWLYPTEAFPTSQRAKGVSLTTASNFAWNIVIAQFVPDLQADVLHFGLFSCFAWFCSVMFVFTLVWVPETKGKSLEQLAKAFDPKKK